VLPEGSHDKETTVKAVEHL